MDLYLKTPLTQEIAEVHLQRAWYVAVGSAAVMGLGGLLTASFNLLLGGVIVIGLGHGMLRRSWVAAGALLIYLVAVLLQAGRQEGQPVLILLAVAVGFFLVQGCRALWWWHQEAQADISPPSV